MKHRKYILVSFLCCLALGWYGCSEEDSYENESTGTGSSLKAYNSRLIAEFNIEASNLEVDVTPISRTGEQQVTLSDMWYAVFETATGQLVPSVDGEGVRHRTLTGNRLDPIEEQLPGGNYTVTFLVMATGGDANAVEPVKSLNDAWLTTDADGTLAGDFFHGLGTVTILPGSAETLPVDMNRVSALFTLTTEMVDEAQKALLDKTEILLDRPLPYGSMTAGGTLKETAESVGQTINMTERGDSFFALTAAEPVSRKGQLVVSISDGKELHQRLYPVGDLTFKRGKRTSHTLNLNLPFDRLGQLDQSAITGQSRMFTNNEPSSQIVKRQFQLDTPLKVTFSANKASIQFFSPVGIGHTEIYARVKGTRDYFKVYELDTIRPFDDITIPSSLLSKEEGFYLTESGRIIKIPANSNLTNDAIECKVLCRSDYWKKIEMIKMSPTIGFHEGEVLTANTRITPYHARLVVGMVLNWGTMLSSPLFEKTLDEWPYPALDASGKKQTDFYYETQKGVIDVSKEEIMERIYTSFGKRVIYFTDAPNLTSEYGAYGAVYQYIKDGRKHSVYVLWSNVWGTLYNTYQWLGHVPYHELAHLLDYPDSYDTPGGKNTMAGHGFVGWNALCGMVYVEMCKNNELPASTVDIFNALDY